MILYINACVRKDSRTDRIAREVLKKLGGAYEEVRLAEEEIAPLSEERLNRRTELIAAGDYSDPMFRWAKQFQQADTVVIGAPYWDLSFPSLLKVYFENIYVTGLVSRYTEDGRPEGLCRGEKLYYVTTAGGPYFPEYSYNYVRDLAAMCFDFKETKLIKAEFLDIVGNDAEQIVGDAIAHLDEMM